MDLGFGGNNQRVGAAATSALLNSARAQEEAVNDQLNQYDRLLEDTDALAQLRAKRVAEMQAAHQQRQKWVAAGHGEYQELGGGHNSSDTAKEFFAASKASENLVVHFYRPSTRLCDVFHAHLQKLAPKHLETRFVKINVENSDKDGSGASFLVERLGIVIMPTLVLIKNRQAVHHIRGFDELGMSENFSTDNLAFVLGVHGVLTRTEEEEESPPRVEGVKRIQIHKPRDIDADDFY
jgi:Thioredoxin